MSDVDDKLAAAWRAASREEPPAALDTALRAAARRAVHAGPARSRHLQSWPLAAAAVVAVLAIGILQLAPPEEVTPGIVADDTMRQTPAKKADAAPPVASSASLPATPAATPPASSEQAAKPAAAETSRRDGPPAPTRELANAPQKVAQAPQAPPAAALDRFSEKRSAAAEADLAKEKLSARADAEQPADSKVAAARDARESNSTLSTPRAEPFPAAPAAAGAGNKSLAATDAATAGRMQAGAMFAAPAPPPASSPADAPSASEKPQAATANAVRAEESQARAAAPMGLAKTAAAPERVKDAAIKPPEEWIKLIRRLKSEGRNDEAAKELAAFRAAYKERADSLLPADLREARP